MEEKEKTEELSPEIKVEETPEEKAVGGQEEEIGEPAKTTEESSEEKKEEEDQEPSKEPKEEYTKERHDGLMSQWQTDKTARLNAEKEVEQLKTNPPAEPAKSNEDKWMDFLYGKFRERDTKERAAEDDAAQIELKETLVEFPKLEKNKILDTAIKYHTSLMDAGQIIVDQEAGKTVQTTLTKKEQERKDIGGKIGGKTAPSAPSGLTPYDSKLSLEENMQKGMEELGIS